MPSVRSSAALADRMKVRHVAEGLITESMDRRIPNSNQALTSQGLQGELVELVQGEVVSKMVTYIGVAGGTMTLGRMGIYSGTSLVATTANAASAFTSQQVLSLALSANYVVPVTGGYYLAVLNVGTTGASLLAPNHVDASLFVAISPGAGPTVAMAGQADLPATATWAVNGLKPLWIACA